MAWDYLIWKYLKNIVYQQPLDKTSEMKIKIAKAVASVDGETFKKSTKAWKSFMLYTERRGVISNILYAETPTFPASNMHH